MSINDKNYEIMIDFGPGIPASAQADTMLAMEKTLRLRGIPADVFTKTTGDDSKLRVLMTPEERQKL